MLCPKTIFLYLRETEKNYKEIKLEDLADFVGWLRHPYTSLNVASITPVKSKKTEKTVNLTITTVTNFYDYLYRNEEISKDMNEKLMRQIYTGGRTRYKSFLHHINKNKPSIRNVLKVKEPRKRIQILTKSKCDKLSQLLQIYGMLFLFNFCLKRDYVLERLFLYIWRTLYLTIKKDIGFA
ncbi:hypothetical protein BCM0060_2929 [Bacillus cereus]|nr:hypothetical protein BCM0060_2929 [Bacillus cereus]